MTDVSYTFDSISSLRHKFVFAIFRCFTPLAALCAVLFLTGSRVCASAPTITHQPVAATVNAGQTAAFSVTATGSPTPTYQWQVSTNGGSTWANCTTGTGITSSAYTTVTTTSAMNGQKFRVQVSNSGGTVTSSAVALTVRWLTFTAQPANVTVTAGNTAGFTATVSSNPAATYQWQKSTNGGSTWSNVSGGSGATTTHYTTGALTLTDNNARFRLNATNAVGTVSSNSATLTVVAAPVITSFSAASSVINSGSSTTLTGVFTGGSGQVTPGIGAVTSNVAVSTGVLTVTKTYQLTVTNAAGTSVAKQTTVAIAGSLTVTISGLPTGVAADVLVTGPGAYTHALTGSATLSGLAPGNYSISARIVTNSGTAYRSTTAIQSVVVTSSTTSTASATYTSAMKAFVFTPYLNNTMTLSLFDPSLSGATASINGADNAGPDIPFTFDWGDGQITNDFFPASHTYSNTAQNYHVIVTSHYDDGSSNTTDTWVLFVTPTYSFTRLSSVLARVTVPSTTPTLSSTYAPYGAPTDLSAFADTELPLPRSPLEYTLDVSNNIETDFCNNSIDPSAGVYQVLLKQTSFSGAYSVWYTNPIALAADVTFLSPSPDYSSLFHEMGHNLTLNSPASYRLGGKIDGDMNAIFSEFLAQVFQHSTAYEILNDSAYYNLPPEIVTQIRARTGGSMTFVEQTYENYVANGFPFATYNDPSTGDDETFGTFMTAARVFFENAEKQGEYRASVKRMMQVFQTFNSTDQTRYQVQSNDSFRATFVVAAMSYGFGRDLRSEFTALGFTIDNAVYTELMNRVQ